MNYVNNELRQIDEMTGDDFENYMTKLLSKAGYKYMVHTPMVNDHGLDAYGYTKDDTKIGFQFKRFQEKVPYSAIYETIGGARFYHTKINVLITNNFYADNTIKTCKLMNESDPNKPILLWNRYKLKALIYQVYTKEQKKIKDKLQKRRERKNKIENQKRLIYNQQLRKNKFVKNVSHLLMNCNFWVSFPKVNSNLDMIGKRNNKVKVGIKFILGQKTYVSRNLIYSTIKDMNINKAKKFTRVFIITDGLIEIKERTRIYNHFQNHIFILKDHKDINDLSSSFGTYISKFVNKYIINKIHESESNSSISSSNVSQILLQSSASKDQSLTSSGKSSLIPNKSSSLNSVNESESQHGLKAHRTFAKLYYLIKRKEAKNIKAYKSKVKKRHIHHKQLLHAGKFVNNNIGKSKIIYTKLLCKIFRKNVISYLCNIKNYSLYKNVDSNYSDFTGYDSYGKHIIIKFLTPVGSSTTEITYPQISTLISLKVLNIDKRCKILFITNKTFTPSKAVKIHNKYPNIYLRDYNLNNLRHINKYG